MAAPPKDRGGAEQASDRPRTRGIHGWRRRIQLAFVVVFFALLTLTVWPLGRVFLGAFLATDPLIALNSAVNGVVLWPFALIAAVLLLAPLLLGRAFCGYVCPFGAIVEATTPSEGPGRLSPESRQRLRLAPAFVLVGVAGVMLFASGAFLLFDPLATLTRSATVLLYPVLDRVVRLGGDLLYLIGPLQVPVDFVTSQLAGRLVFTEPLAYQAQLFALALLVGVLSLSWLEPRMWCRDLCPLGALLGFVGRFAIVGRVVDVDACISCGRCERVCSMDAVRDDFHATDTSRCQLGLECADVCPTGAISVGRRPAKRTFSPSRRALLATGGLSLLGGFLLYSRPRRAEAAPHLVRPPGSREETALLALCSRCGQCMKVCPTNVLQPSLLDGGIEGVFTPSMVFRIGSCDWACNECGKVCPTGAIEPLTLARKRQTVIGRASIDRNRCIPYADGRTCLVCQELCPVPDKAIAIREADVITPEGQRARLGQPVVIEERCIGCGVCELHCPVAVQSAIRVYSTAGAPDGGADSAS